MLLVIQVFKGSPLKSLKELSQIVRRKFVRHTEFSDLREFQKFNQERHLNRWKHSIRNFVMEQWCGLGSWQEEAREMNVCGNA